jgi:hypothetical protein
MHTPLPSRVIRSAVAPLLALLVLAAFPRAASSFETDFSDTEFPDFSWQGMLIAKTPSGFASVSASQVATGGNPGAYRRGVMSYGNTGLVGGNLLVSATHDPSSQGAVTTVSFGFDAIGFTGGNPNTTTEDVPLAVDSAGAAARLRLSMRPSSRCPVLPA